MSSDIILQGGVPPAGELAPKPASDGAFGILSVCRVTKSKRLDWVLEGLAKLRGEEGWPAGFRPILEIVGEGPEEAGLKLLAERLGLSDFVKFRGFVSAQELEECYRRAHLFVMPAIQGYGLPALEALYRRVPVLMHSDSGVSEIFDHNPWAEIVSGGPQDYANAFVHAVRRILTSPPSIEEFPHLPTEEGWAAEIVRQCDWKLPQP
ncbi:MAG: glycosyltransferase [Chthoniobacterales bacterium]